MPTPNEAVKSILINRRARHEYHVLDTLEVGIVLRGTEVKSIRAGTINVQDSYAAIDKGELYLHNMHISPFEKGNIFNHDPVRVRKLLARRKEILKLAQKTNEKGLTLIPLQVYFLGRHVKIELGICKGKKLYDKRESLKTRDIQREMERDR
jgi:SsrA-binding protein